VKWILATTVLNMVKSALAAKRPDVPRPALDALIAIVEELAALLSKTKASLPLEEVE
jgi:hypothetical protein